MAASLFSVTSTSMDPYINDSLHAPPASAMDMESSQQGHLNHNHMLLLHCASVSPVPARSNRQPATHQVYRRAARLQESTRDCPGMRPFRCRRRSLLSG
jgi:hypothetical protein